MIRTRHRLLAGLAAVVAMAVAAQASASPLTVLDYNAAKTFGNVHIAGGAIDLTNGAMIVTTSSFGFVPSGAPGEYGTVGMPEYGDPAIHDALIEGKNTAGSGYWNGSNGIFSSNAANDPNAITAVGWVDNSVSGYTSFRGVPVNSSQSIIGYTYYGDANMDGSVDVNNDLTLWSSTFNGGATAIPGEVNWQDGAWAQNPSNTVDVNNDLTLWSGVFNSPSYVPLNYIFAPVVPSSVAAVPEPASISLLATLILVGLGYARRRSSSNS